MKIGSLCTGYGGLDMAVEAYFNAETVWTSDIDKYASIVIRERLNKPNLGDLKMIDWQSLEPIDILTAGYPCQPFSSAGNRKGATDERHIWPYIKEAVGQLRPKFVILENVRGHLSLGFKEVLADLSEIGYDARWQIVRAADVGAPHRRERLFVVAYPNGTRCERIIRPSDGSGQSGEVIANPDGNEQQGDGKAQKLGRRFDTRDQMRLRSAPNPLELDKLNPKFVEYMMGLPSGWVTDLDISRAQQLKILGNGVVPQQAFYALELLCQDVSCG
jgi:DNA (cytosine-5)-methyltransferase 1